MKFRECPCHKDGKDCTKRKVGCHDKCPEYKEWRAEKDADNKAKHHCNNKAYIDYIVPKIRQRKRRKNEKKHSS